MIRAGYITALMTAFLMTALLGSACNANPVDTAPQIDADTSSAQALSLACQSCHVKDGEVIPDYTHLSKEELAARLTHFKTTKGESVMHRIMSGYSQADIERLSHYLAHSGHGNADE